MIAAAGLLRLSLCSLFMSDSPGIELRAAETFRVSQLNAWMLPLAMPDKAIRAVAIGERVARQESDIVLLQEAFAKNTRTRIQDRSNLNAGIYYDKKRLFSSGLYTLANSPMLDTGFFEFTLAGNPLAFWKPDPLAAKGVGYANLEIAGRPVSVFNTHLLARHGKDALPEDTYTPDRMNQMFEVFAFIVERSASKHFVIGGDFNMRWFQPEYQFWIELTGLKGLTLEGPDNSFCTSCAPNVYKPNDFHHGQLDYIFVAPTLNISGWQRDFDVAFEKWKGKTLNHSNHFGLTTDVAFEKNAAHSPTEQRRRTHHALLQLMARLTGKYETPHQNGSKGRAIARVAHYLEALEGRPSNDPDIQRTQRRLDWYFDLFK